jgi:hypothetical protein
MSDEYELWCRFTEIGLRAVWGVKAISPKDAGDVAIEGAKDLLAAAYRLKGVACSACDGRGEVTYGETSSTIGICERCWGTGRADKTGPDLRRIEELELEIDRWKDASGLERGGDPDGVTPDDLRKEIECLVKAQETYLVTVDKDLVQLIGTEVCLSDQELPQEAEDKE